VGIYIYIFTCTCLRILLYFCAATLSYRRKEAGLLLLRTSFLISHIYVHSHLILSGIV
jgi:hypothetical protein